MQFNEDLASSSMTILHTPMLFSEVLPYIIYSSMHTS